MWEIFFKAQESYWISDIWITFNTPKKHISSHFSDVQDSMAKFRAVGVWNYSMLTLAEHERVLYVGAREHIFALDPNNISRQLRPQVCLVKKKHFISFRKPPNAPKKYYSTSHQAKRALAFYLSEISAFKNDSLFQWHSHL